MNSTHHIKQLVHDLNAMEAMLPSSGLLHPDISSVSIGWHLQHSLLVVTQICNALELSNPKKYIRDFNLQRNFIFVTRHIPRGKGRAPDSVMPQMPGQEDRFAFQNARTKVEKLPNLHPNAFFTHPRFGRLNVRLTLQFLSLHTRHHLLIAEDICKRKK